MNYIAKLLNFAASLRGCNVAYQDDSNKIRKPIRCKAGAALRRICRLDKVKTAKNSGFHIGKWPDTGKYLVICVAVFFPFLITPALSQDWGPLATISNTMGVHGGRLCLGEASRNDIGCPTYAPSLSTAGHVSVTGNLSATKFIGDGSGLSGISGDNLGNHIATQNLGLGANAIVFGNTIDDKIYLYSNTYGLGIESSNLTSWAAGFRWRTGGTSASSGTERMRLGTAGLIVTGYVSTTGVIDAGAAIYGYQGDSVTAPGYTWSGDTHTGMYWVGNDQIGLTVGGVQQVLVRSTGIVVSGSVMANNVGDLATTPSYSWSGDTNTGMYWVGADQLGVTTGGFQRVLVNNSGLRVSGTLTTVGGNATIDGSLSASGGAVLGNGYLNINGSRDITSAIAGGQILIQDGTTANSGSKLRIDVNELQAQLDGGAGTYTLNPFGGQVNIGSSSYGANLVVRGIAATCALGNGTGTTSCTSDRRLKQDIEPLQGSLEKIAALQGVHFKWKKDPSATRIGLIAQDVERQFPEVVETDPDTGMKAVAYASLVAPLIEAVKEQQVEIRKLRADNDNLRVRLERLESRIR